MRSVVAHARRLLGPVSARVTLAMSGGVDSSVAAALLRDAGCSVSGVYMHNWDLLDETGQCTADREWNDVQHVCRVLDVPCERINLSREYWSQVFECMVDGYVDGCTPNPDVLCNQQIKFGALYNRLFADSQQSKPGLLATGHYAQTSDAPWVNGSSSQLIQRRLQRSVDREKDQTYFLCTVNGNVLSRVLFPVGHIQKDQVKQLALHYGLNHIAHKKESMGICFVGKRKSFGDFLDNYIHQQPGDFIGPDGHVIGRHTGYAKYTVGQAARIHSLGVRYFVVSKDVKTNTVYVVPGRDHPKLYSNSLSCTHLNWIHPEEENLALSENVLVQIRHRQAPQSARICKSSDGSYTINFDAPVRGITAGQIAAIYHKDICLGGGVITTLVK